MGPVLLITEPNLSTTRLGPVLLRGDQHLNLTCVGFQHILTALEILHAHYAVSLGSFGGPDNLSPIFLMVVLNFQEIT